MNALYYNAGWTSIVGFLVTALFPLYTIWFWPWWRKWWGWNIVVLDEFFALAVGLDALAFIDPGMSAGTRLALAWCQVGFVQAYVLFIIWRTVMIYRTQRRGAIRDHAAAGSAATAADGSPAGTA